MKQHNKILLLGFLTLIVIAGVFFLKPIPQSLSFHNFADRRIFLGVSNFANVITNLPFVIVGITGLFSLRKSNVSKSLVRIYAILFAAVILTALGSAYYHLHPDNNSLVYDRIPMTLVFMSLLCATIAEMIEVKMADRLLFPLLLTGAGSVLYWHYTEQQGRGDLRLYGLVQFYPMLLIPLILVLFSSRERNNGIRPLIWVVVWYIIAKLLEHYDQIIYSSLKVISGHGIKHLAAAMSTWWLVKLFRVKHLS